MLYTTIAPILAFVLGAVALPAEAVSNEAGPHDVVFTMFSGPSCNEQPRSIPYGSYYIDQNMHDLCLPLEDDVHSLDVTTIKEGCKLTAFHGPMCNNVENLQAYTTKDGCHWANMVFKSFKVTCA
ncbi:hypothetical protein DL546_004944 [Coniochaeta pulveracea]|uniref:Uncharacterized protein n=1 Tax=Coniochaeta pulveracea TaxID=177199 RepID=A0A420Y3U7_9PEZI|nr:hypothetical protein DL546_004944 [Coniochaeta pulveracea]